MATSHGFATASKKRKRYQEPNTDSPVKRQRGGTLPDPEQAFTANLSEMPSIVAPAGCSVSCVPTAKAELHTVVKNSEFMKHVQQSIDTFLSSSRKIPTEAESTSRARIVDWMEHICKHEFGPQVFVYVFGSTAYDMYVVDSDLDLNVYCNQPIPHFFERLQSILLAQVPPIELDISGITARIPVARFTHPTAKLKVEVVHQCGSTNERDEQSSDFHHSQQITAWVKKWTSCYPFLKGLGRIVKLWSATRGINSPYYGTLPSLAYLVMLFTVCEKVCREHPNVATLPAHVLVAFFYRYAHWERKQLVITSDSVGWVEQEGNSTTRHMQPSSVERFLEQAVKQDRDGTGFGRTLFIQDPLLLDINLGRFVDTTTWPKIHKEFVRAWEILLAESQVDSASGLENNLIERIVGGQ